MEADSDDTGFGSQTITDLVQTTHVDEKGTTAAVATGGVATALSAVGENRTIVFDRPYLLLITDTAIHTPLFELVVANPQGLTWVTT